MIQSKDTRFKKGHNTHNKGKKLTEYVSPEAIERMQTTQFKEGITGKDHISWKGGLTKNKTDVTLVWVGNNKRARRPDLVYGTKPQGYIIYHLDGDKDNDELDNLIAIPRAIGIALNTGRLINTRETIEVAIKEYEENSINADRSKTR